MDGKIKLENLNPVSETLLYPLYMRAEEARRPDAMVCDDKAVRLVDSIDYDFSRFKGDPLDIVAGVMRVRHFDQLTRQFVQRHPNGAVVSLGCGLDTRFERVDNGQVQWYNLDLPEVIALRGTLLPDPPRCQAISVSAFDPSWMDALAGQEGRPLLCLAEGLFPYFREEDIRRLVLALHQRFPGSELAFDISNRLLLWIHKFELRRTKMAAELHWGLDNDRALESWASGIRLLSSWAYFDEPEPRLGRFRLMRYLPFLGRAARILHYQL